MTKEMLFLADIYTNWCKSQGLPDFMSADDLRYGRDTTDKLNFYQMNWLECFIDVWDCINQNTQEIIMQTEKRYEHEFHVTRRCTKMEYYTVKANSMEEAEWEAENSNELFNFDWEEFDFEIVKIEEQEIPEQQLTLSGVLN